MILWNQLNGKESSEIYMVWNQPKVSMEPREKTWFGIRQK